jgi:hypothetical protein
MGRGRGVDDLVHIWSHTVLTAASSLASTVVPGLCGIPSALGITVAAQPPETHSRLLWSLHPLSVHCVCHFRH